MRNGKRLEFALLSIFLPLVLLVLWIPIAPAQMGGGMTYVIVDGNSMEPRFHLGDLVLIRREPAYAVGDAVVYMDSTLGIHVFHRIVGQNLDRFILKGDNNSWQDSYSPVQDEILGKLWLHLPRVGWAVKWLQTPIHLAATAGLLGGFLMLDLIKKSSNVRRNKRTIDSGTFAHAIQSALLIVGLLGMIFLGLGIVSFTRPLDLPSTANPYQQEGNYFYSAAGTPGVYDKDIVQAGEPIFPKLTCFLNVGFAYNLVGTGISAVSGGQSMYARIFDEVSGWQRTIPLTTTASFTGTSHLTTATLDLCQVESLVNLVETQAGTNQIIYSLEIVSDTAFTAMMNGVEVSDTFSPKLVFTYDKVQFYLAENESGNNPLYATKAGLAGESSSTPGTITLLGFTLPVWMTRVVSIIGFGSSLAALVAILLYWHGTAGQNEEAVVRLKYGNRLVRINNQMVPSAAQIIEVTSMDDLARLADRYGAMILSLDQSSGRYYYVQTEAAVYRYVIRAADSNHSNSHENSQRAYPPTEAGTPDTTQKLPHAGNGSSRDTNGTRYPAGVPSKAATRKDDPQAASLYTNTKASGNQPRSSSNPRYTEIIYRTRRELTEPENQAEYVISTGILECILPTRKAILPRSELLQACDPSSDY